MLILIITRLLSSEFLCNSKWHAIGIDSFFTAHIWLGCTTIGVSMIIIIDGYNVLKRNGKKEIPEYERGIFIKTLAHYAKIKKHAITLVFDGGISRRPEHYKELGIDIVYSGTELTADEYIKLYVQKHPNRQIMVVSADRDLGRRVQNAGGVMLDPVAFMTFLMDVSAHAMQKGDNQKAITKTSADTLQEIDLLMQEAAEQRVHKDEQERQVIRERPSKKVSKQERTYLQKLKKL